jgi:fucose permease
MNDGAPGAMVPLFGEYYRLSHSIVSLIFLSPMVGCVLASFSTNRLHAVVGRRGVAAMATGAYMLAYLGLSQHPPFGVVVCLMILTGFGSGLMNGSWNSWFGGLVQGSTMLGFLHGFWGLGATLSPILVCGCILLHNGRFSCIHACRCRYQKLRPRWKIGGFSIVSIRECMSSLLMYLANIEQV